MKRQTIHAEYRSQRLSFRGAPPRIPDGADVTVIFPVEAADLTAHGHRAIVELRGRAKGERLTERLLRSRKEDS